MYLTDARKEIVEKTYEHHCVLTAGTINMGVDPKQTEQDACRIEHAISDESFLKLQKYFMKTK